MAENEQVFTSLVDTFDLGDKTKKPGLPGADSVTTAAIEFAQRRNVLEEVFQLVWIANGMENSSRKKLSDGIMFIDIVQTKLEEAGRKLAQKEDQLKILYEENQKLRASVSTELNQVPVGRLLRRLEGLQKIFDEFACKMDEEHVKPNQQYESRRRKVVENFKREVTELFKKISKKFKNWENTQVEMERELDIGKKALGKLNEMTMITKHLKSHRVSERPQGSRTLPSQEVLPQSEMQVQGCSSLTDYLRVQYQQFHMETLINSLNTLYSLPVPCKDKIKSRVIAKKEHPLIWSQLNHKALVPSELYLGSSGQSSTLQSAEIQVTTKPNDILEAASVISYAEPYVHKSLKESPRSTTSLTLQSRPVFEHPSTVSERSFLLPPISHSASPPCIHQELSDTASIPQLQAQPVDIQIILPTTSRMILPGKNVCGFCGISFNTIVQKKLHQTIVHSKSQPRNVVTSFSPTVIPTSEVSHREMIPEATSSHPLFRHHSLMKRIPSGSGCSVEFISENEKKHTCQRQNLNHPYHHQAHVRSTPYSNDNLWLFSPLE